jgi:hypothetical protein
MIALAEKRQRQKGKRGPKPSFLIAGGPDQ